MSGWSNSTYRVELTVSGRIAATLPFPAAARDLNCFMTVKVLLNELVEIPEGPLTRTEAEAPPPPTLTSVADNTRESPPSSPALLKRTLSPLVLDRPFERAPYFLRSTRV